MVIMRMKMLTNRATRETMMASLRSPEALCERLGLRPTEYQREIMHRFYEDEDPLQVSEVAAEHTVKAAAICALWRLLRVDRSKCIVIAANRELESHFMGFMYQITTEIDPALTSTCHWSNGKVMRVGNDPVHELRFVSNRPNYLLGINDDNITWVILGARSSERRFGDTMKVVDGYRKYEGHRHIVVW